MADPHCCFTSITFKSTGNKKTTVTVTNATGAISTHEFKKKDEEAVARMGPKDAPMPGGLGRCVTISITQPPRAAETWTLCCDQEGLCKGLSLRHSTAGGGGTVEVFNPLDVAGYEVADPCIDETPGTGQSDRGQAASGIKPMEGVKHADRTRWGAACRLRFTTKNCRKLGFVQAKKRRVLVKRPGAKNWSNLQPPDDRYRLNIEAGATTPLYPYTADVTDGLEMTDTPGIDDPWGKFTVDGKEHQLPKGSKLQIVWEFKAWVICMDNNPPVTILGHF